MIAERLGGLRPKAIVASRIVLCIDQSGSMAASIVYSSIFGAVLASLRAVTTRLVVFDTAVVDLTDQLDDPVDLLFGTQLGGGTDINRAVNVLPPAITRPAQTIFVLVSDLVRRWRRGGLSRQTAELVSSGVTMICLLALSDQGSPCYDERLASQMTALGARASPAPLTFFPA